MGDNILVMCDTYEPPRVAPDGTVEAPKPIPTNTRFSCAAVMEKAKDEEPWCVLFFCVIFVLFLVCLYL
jgi:glutamine synthetase